MAARRLLASMSVTERSRDAFDQLLEGLESVYGEFDVIEKDWRHPAPFYERLVDRFEDGYPGGAGAWVYDSEGRVLLVRYDGRAGWTDPGVKRRPDESFEAAAKRAVRQETGVDVAVTGVVEVHEVEVWDGTDPARPRLYEPIVVFAAMYQGGDPEPNSDEVAEVDWFTEHPPTGQYEDVEDRPIPYHPNRE